MEIQPYKIFAGEGTDRCNNVASEASPILKFDDGLRTFFERYRNLQPIHERYAPARVRPYGPCVREQRFAVDVLRISFKQLEAVALQDEVEAPVVLLVAFGVGSIYAKEKCATFPSEYHARQREGRTLYFRAAPMLDFAYRRIQ